MQAEQAYLFRHALMKDAAYQLQLPGDRARLHALALQILEEVISRDETEDFRAIMALELADHAQAASLGEHGPKAADFLMRELKYRQLAASHLKKNYQLKSAGAVFRRIVEHPNSDDSLRFDASYGAAECAKAGAQLAETMALATAAEDAARRLNDPDKRLRAAHLRAVTIADLGRAQEAMDMLRELIREAEERGLHNTYGDGMSQLASLMRFSGEVAKSEPLLRRALARSAELAPDIVARLKEQLAHALRLTGHPAQAENLYRELLEYARNLKMKTREASLMVSLAGALYDVGRIQEAYELNMSAVALLKSNGLTQSLPGALANGAAYLITLDRKDEAEVLSRESVALSRESGNRRSEASDLSTLAIVLYKQSKFKEAEQAYLEALVLLRQTRNVEFEGITLGNLGALYRWVGRLDEAQAMYAKALEIHTQVGNKRFIGLTHGLLAVLYRCMKRESDCALELKMAKSTLEALGDEAAIAGIEDQLKTALDPH